MRGLIKGDVESNTLLIIGYLNWYIVFFTAFIAFSVVLSSIPSWAPLIIIAVLFNFVQASRYNKVAELAIDWLKKNR